MSGTPKQRVRACLQDDPKPLVHPARKLALMWSAKCACTFSIKWFLHHLGQLEAAEFYHPWIHNYRTQVFFESHEYRTWALDTLVDPELRTVKVVRNPFARAVSSYVHAFVHRYEDAGLERFLARPIDEQQRFTFREFVAYLGTLDLDSCNIHHRRQVHPLEVHALVRVTHLVQLEHSAARLPQVERELGFEPSDLGRFSRSIHHTARNPDTGFWGDRIPALEVGQEHPVVPQTAAFYDDDLRAAVAALYAVDFATYGYEPQSLDA